jgi:hypothetical protein
VFLHRFPTRLPGGGSEWVLLSHHADEERLMESEDSVALLLRNQSPYRLHSGTDWLPTHTVTNGTTAKILFTGQIMK